MKVMLFSALFTVHTGLLLTADPRRTAQLGPGIEIETWLGKKTLILPEDESGSKVVILMTYEVLVQTVDKEGVTVPERVDGTA